jgi:hypothetical protein
LPSQRSLTYVVVFFAVFVAIVSAGAWYYDRPEARTERADAAANADTPGSSPWTWSWPWSRATDLVDSTPVKKRRTLFDELDPTPFAAAVVVLIVTMFIPMSRLLSASAAIAVAAWGAMWVLATVGKFVLVAVFPPLFLMVFPETADAVRGVGLRLPLGNAFFGTLSMLLMFLVPIFAAGRKDR